MPQVLEAPELQDEAQQPLAIHDGYPDKSSDVRAMPMATTHRHRIPVLHAILSVFTRQRKPSVPACPDTTAGYESALDHMCRTDPYFCTKALAG